MGSEIGVALYRVDQENPLVFDYSHKSMRHVLLDASPSYMEAIISLDPAGTIEDWDKWWVPVGDECRDEVKRQKHLKPCDLDVLVRPSFHLDVQVCLCLCALQVRHAGHSPRHWTQGRPRGGKGEDEKPDRCHLDGSGER